MVGLQWMAFWFSFVLEISGVHNFLVYKHFHSWFEDFIYSWCIIVFQGPYHHTPALDQAPRRNQPVYGYVQCLAGYLQHFTARNDLFRLPAASPYTPIQTIYVGIIRLESMSHLNAAIHVFTALYDSDTEALRSIMVPSLNKSPTDSPTGGSASPVSTITKGYNDIKKAFKSKWRRTSLLLLLWLNYVGTCLPTNCLFWNPILDEFVLFKENATCNWIFGVY